MSLQRESVIRGRICKGYNVCRECIAMPMSEHPVPRRHPGVPDPTMPGPEDNRHSLAGSVRVILADSFHPRSADRSLEDLMERTWCICPGSRIAVPPYSCPFSRRILRLRKGMERGPLHRQEGIHPGEVNRIPAGRAFRRC